LTDEIEIVCLAANKSAEALYKSAQEFKPKYVTLSSENADARMLEKLDYKPVIMTGKNALTTSALECGADLVILAVEGITGLETFAACLKNKIPVALANKESLVCGGDVILEIMRTTGTGVLPVDSEHSAIFQCLGDSYDTSRVKKLMVTASGGPFRGRKREELKKVTVGEALRHPNWSMGKKITIDSATLANKGLEVIEAHFLFGMDLENIEVLVHPQSVVHSMVEFKDNSIIAQMGPVDMHLPLQKSMLFPKMLPFVGNKSLNLFDIGKLTFEKPDLETFSCLALAYDALREKGALTTIFNVANEAAVALFIREKIGFLDIANLISESMDKFAGESCKSIEEILHINDKVREYLLHKYDI
jgi:1-deoxy-D-xylulose-5-phosphate reductoisomerase